MSGTLKRVLGHLGSLPSESRPCLLLGERGSGKTTLLLTAALRASADDGRGAVFIARNPLQSLPAGARDPLSLKKIQFVYPRSLEELQTFIASMHEKKSSPSLILLDGIDDYLDGNSGQQLVARLSALLVDTAAYFTEKLRLTSRRPDDALCCCHLIVSIRLPRESGEETEGAQERLVIDRYFPEKCWLQRDAEWPGAGAQVDGAEQYYMARFSDRQVPNLDICSSNNDDVWRLGIVSDGTLKAYPARSKGQGHEETPNALDAALPLKVKKQL
ncbi:ATPase SWSAP1 [Ambystoma mexicanum]|uniref:ATPase SWSAP1 n=1 Tax=Ambystoma mexicanum TaxID=8296 RepID=UPI0037E96DA5